MTEFELRCHAIKRYLANEKPKQIYTSMKRSKRWFFKWLNRYQAYGDAGLYDKSRRPFSSPNKTSSNLEETVVNIRKTLALRNSKETFYAPIGADSISWELNKLGLAKVPSIPTINRIIKRNGLSDKQNKITNKHSIPYPAIELYRPNNMHQLDPVGPRFIKGTKGVEKFYSVNLVDCYSKMVALRQYEDTRNSTILDFLTKVVWPYIGFPEKLQVDNMLSIKGSNMHPRSPGIVIRLCLLFDVEVVFIPINEPQRNGVVESFNNIFDKVFYQRQRFENLEHLKRQSRQFENYYCTQRPHSRLSISKHGTKIPSDVHFKEKPRLLSSNFSINDFKVKGKIKIPLNEGKISFIRWVNKNCKLDIFSEKFALPETLKYHYVKATILTKEQVLQVWCLNELALEIPYVLMD